MVTEAWTDDSRATREMARSDRRSGWWCAIGWWLNSSLVHGAPLAVSGPGEARHYGLILGVFALVAVAASTRPPGPAGRMGRPSQAAAQVRPEVRP